VIRRATPDDIEALVGVQGRGWRHAYGDFVDVDEMPGPQERSARWRQRLGGDGTTFVWEQDGEVVGFVACGADRDREAGTGQVYAIYVDPAAQGAGLGSTLLAHAVQELATVGFGRALLWCLEANGLARAFYASRGWEQDGGRREHPWGLEVRYRREL
jgi:GNAT superfamily N-acetyltransferase